MNALRMVRVFCMVNILMITAFNHFDGDERLMSFVEEMSASECCDAEATSGTDGGGVRDSRHVRGPITGDSASIAPTYSIAPEVRHALPSKQLQANSPSPPRGI